jgi:type IV secretory pathway TrbL component
MACNDCDDNIWKQKLGRCKRCMWLNFVLLISSTGLSFFMWQTEPKSVHTIALLFTFFCSALLMLLHIIAFLYYRLVKG